MQHANEAWDALAAAVEYPRLSTAEQARRASSMFGTGGDDSKVVPAALGALAEWLEARDIGEAEERYTTLFDLQPVATLNLGYHIFGDTYERGALLAGLVREHNRHGVNFDHDLPDAMPALLRLLGRMEDDEDRRLLVHAVVLPALAKVNQAIEKSTDPWSALVRSISPLLDVEVPKGDREILPPRKRSLEVLPC
jgi:nitrate reductase delta subunit